jgi:hypothetical protein
MTPYRLVDDAVSRRLGGRGLPGHPHLPTDLGIEGPNDRFGGELGLVDVVGRPGSAGYKRLGLQHHRIPQPILVGVPGQPNHAADFPGLGSDV